VLHGGVEAGIWAALTGPRLSIDLHLLEQGLSQLNTTIAIPLDHSIIFVRFLNCAYYAARLSEVAQTLDSISGVEFLIDCSGFGKPRSLGAI
jgi:hypothetical protein